MVRPLEPLSLCKSRLAGKLADRCLDGPYRILTESLPTRSLACAVMAGRLRLHRSFLNLFSAPASKVCRQLPPRVDEHGSQGLFFVRGWRLDRYAAGGKVSQGSQREDARDAKGVGAGMTTML